MNTLLNGESLGQNIRQLRQAAGKKAAEVAQKLGISESAYTRYERGEVSPTIDFISEIAAIINVPPLQLLTIPIKHVINNKTDDLSNTIIPLFNERSSSKEEQSKKAILALIKKMMMMHNEILEKLK